MEILRRETDYAMRALVKIAEEGGLVSTRYLAEQCDISLDHVRKILPKLAKAGLVVPVRGARGGFQLQKRPEDIRLKEIVDAIQGPLQMNQCTLGSGECCRHQECSMVNPVRYLQQRLDEMTRRMSLKDLVEGKTDHAMGDRNV